MGEAIIVGLVLVACVAGYFVIGDLLHRVPGRRTSAEEQHRREQPLSDNDVPGPRIQVNPGTLGGVSSREDRPGHLGE